MGVEYPALFSEYLALSAQYLALLAQYLALIAQYPALHDKFIRTLALIILLLLGHKGQYSRFY